MAIYAPDRDPTPYRCSRCHRRGPRESFAASWMVDPLCPDCLGRVMPEGKALERKARQHLIVRE